MNYLSICAIVKNEAPYIEEWLKYHHGIGVEHFYLYENFSRDLTYPIIIKLASSYPITVVRIRGNAMQFPAYEKCLAITQGTTRWLAFIDVDEFIVPCMDLKLLLKDYEPYPALVAHWYFFGSSGRTEYTPEPVVERFTKRESAVNPHIKSIVNPAETFGCKNPHVFVHTRPPVDEHFNPLVTSGGIIAPPSGLQENGTCDLIQINHYGVKSFEECADRRSRPRAHIGTMYPPMPRYFVDRDLNQVEDLKALNIWRELHGN